MKRSELETGDVAAILHRQAKKLYKIHKTQKRLSLFSLFIIPERETSDLDTSPWIAVVTLAWKGEG